MARLDWTTFLAAHPQAHLLAGHVPEPNPAVLKRLRRLMQALIDGEAPVGDYATAIVRRRDITEIQCGFADRSDAERVGARLRAKSVPPSGDWLSERTLRLDERAEVALEDTAGRAGPSGRHVPPLPTTNGPRQPRRGPGAKSGAWPPVVNHRPRENTSNLELLENPVFRGFAGFSARAAAPGPTGRGGPSTVDVNKGDPGRPRAH